MSQPHGYARWVTVTVAERCGGLLRASYLHGSAALGGWNAQRSDVDVLFVASGDLDGEAVRAVGDALLAAGEDFPGRGLEASMVTVSQAAEPAGPWPFLVHVGASAGERHITYGADLAGDPDLLMHYEACRAVGIALLGPGPRDLIGPVPRDTVLSYLAGELKWGLANASECYAVLNACRAVEFLDYGRIVSKVAGGVAALERGTGPADLLRRALDQQQAVAPVREPGPDAVAFVRGIAARLTAAAGGAPDGSQRS